MTGAIFLFMSFVHVGGMFVTFTKLNTVHNPKNIRARQRHQHRLRMFT